MQTARKHEVLMARNIMSNNTDMQDKYLYPLLDGKNLTVDLF